MKHTMIFLCSIIGQLALAQSDYHPQIFTEIELQGEQAQALITLLQKKLAGRDERVVTSYRFFHPWREDENHPISLMITQVLDDKGSEVEKLITVGRENKKPFLSCQLHEKTKCRIKNYFYRPEKKPHKLTVTADNPFLKNHLKNELRKTQAFAFTMEVKDRPVLVIFKEIAAHLFNLAKADELDLRSLRNEDIHNNHLPWGLEGYAFQEGPITFHCTSLAFDPNFDIAGDNPGSMYLNLCAQAEVTIQL